MIFVSLILSGFAFVANAQISGKSIPELRREAAPNFQYSNIPSFQHSNFSPFPFTTLKPTIFYSQPSVPMMYSYENLAFFCKVEVKMEKAVKFPIKFRLGDVEYVDRLEGKRE